MLVSLFVVVMGIPSALAERPAMYAEVLEAGVGARRLPVPRKVSERRLSVDLRGADVRDVLRVLSDYVGVPIVVDASVQGQVTLERMDATWGEIFYAVIEAGGLRWERRGGAIVVWAE